MINQDAQDVMLFNVDPYLPPLLSNIYKTHTKTCQIQFIEIKIRKHYCILIIITLNIPSPKLNAKYTFPNIVSTLHLL